MVTTIDIELLKNNFTFWKHLTQTQEALLLQNTSQNRFPKGKILHYGSDDCLGVLLLKQGSLRVYLLSDEGKEVTLYYLSENDICMLSASCILNAITFDIYIEAEQDCEVFVISALTYSKITSENIYAENFSYKQITQRFSDVMFAIQQLLFIRFDKRLATFLLAEALKANQDTISFTHEQIAKHLGSAREVVSRMLKQFEKENMVSLTRGGIRLLNKQKLRELTSR